MNQKDTRKLYFSLLILIGMTIFSCIPSNLVWGAITYEIDTSTEDCKLIQERAVWVAVQLVKFDITNIPSGTIDSAIFKMYVGIYGSSGDGDVRIYLLSNQTWLEENDGTNLNSMTRGNYLDFSGVLSGGWQEFDVSSLFRSNFGQNNFSLLMEDMDYSINQAASAINDVPASPNGAYGWFNHPSNGYITRTKEGVDPPELTVLVGGQTAGRIQVEYDFPTETDMTSIITLDKFWNDTKLLYRLYLYPYEDSTNVTISLLETLFSFAYILPNCSDWNDTISSSGQIIFYDLFEGTYEVVFDSNQDWHILHISLYAPDGVGLMWESFPIYINNTRVPYPPEYDLESGYYEYEVQDYFSQTVLDGSFTIYTSDQEDVYQNWEVPLYKVAFLNKDVVPYNVEITRNAITRVWPSDSTDIRLYGLAAELPYTIVIRNVNSGEERDSYTLHMSNDPAQRLLDYEPDDPTPGGVAQVIKLLEPRDFILPAFFLLGGFALISSVTSRRTKKQQTRKDWRQAYLTHKGVTHSSQLSQYDQRKFREAEEQRFGKSRLRRRKQA